MNDKTQISDEDIEQYLNGETGLSATYAEGKDLKAPEHLAFAIKRMAREAENNPPNNERPVVRKDVWLVPLSLAATVIITISLVFFVDFQNIDETSQIAKKDIDTPPQALPLPQDGVTPPQQTASVEDTIVLQPETQKTETIPAIKTKPMQQTDTRLPRESASEKPAPTLQSPTQSTLQVAEEPADFELPPHLRDMMQSTNAGAQNEVLPAEVLKTWTRQQWQTQVSTLYKTGKDKLAEQYIKLYPEYYPGETLTKP